MYNGEGEVEVAQTKETIEEIATYPIMAIPGRGIEKTTCEHFGVRVALSGDGKKTIEAIYFPWTKDGKVTGYQKKDLTIKKGEKFHFTAVGSIGMENDVFGRNVSPSSGKKNFTTEGAIDALSAWQVLKAKYPQGTPSVVAVLGTSWAAKQVANNLDYYAGFKENIIALDQDEATAEELKKGVKKGKEATLELAVLIPEMYVADFPENDPNAMLMSGKGEDLYWALISNAKKFVPDEIKFGGDTPLDDLLMPLVEGVTVSCLPILMRKLHGLRKQEMTIILAPTKSGKTTISKEISYSMVKDGGFVGHLYLEESLVKTMQSYLALDNNVLLPAFRADPSIISREAAEKTYKEVIDNGRTIYLSANKLNPESVLRNMRYMAAMGAEYIVLDHLSYVMSGDKSSDERKAIDLLLTELAAFKKEANIHLIVVAHIKRKDFRPKVDSDGDIIYPYWIPVGKEDGRGSAAFEQLADNLIVIEPEVLSEGGERGRIRIKVAAAREWDDTGIADVLTMDRNTGRMVPADEKFGF